mmetsp:Transcript_1084/g.4452  ORF Transcript_1084/g.4452 Transcript_1084/m.4452 type:complete len:271 (-) Transcript_1084:24-836(-)
MPSKFSSHLIQQLSLLRVVLPLVNRAHVQQSLEVCDFLGGRLFRRRRGHLRDRRPTGRDHRHVRPPARVRTRVLGLRILYQSAGLVRVCDEHSQRRRQCPLAPAVVGDGRAVGHAKVQASRGAAARKHTRRGVVDHKAPHLVQTHRPPVGAGPVALSAGAERRVYHNMHMTVGEHVRGALRDAFRGDIAEEAHRGEDAEVRPEAREEERRGEVGTSGGAPRILRDAPDCQDGFVRVASLGCLDEVLVRGLAEELGATVVRHPGHGDERTE